MKGLRRFGPVFFLAVAMLIASASRHAARTEEQVPPPKSGSASCDRSAFRVALDVGHTVEAPGAMSARGTTEYEFNLYLAQDIRQALIDAGFDKTALMITEAKPPEGLFERAMRANAMKADLFVAIHHDSVPDNLMKTWEFEGQQQGYNDDYPGYALFVSNDNADRAGSLAFAHALGKALQARGLQYTPHYTLPLMGRRRRELLDADAGVYRFDELVVLRYTHMPAVLFEAGSIVNRQEELELVTVGRRAVTSAAVVAAVDEFCDARAPAKRMERPVARASAPGATVRRGHANAAPASR